MQHGVVFLVTLNTLAPGSGCGSDDFEGTQVVGRITNLTNYTPTLKTGMALKDAWAVHININK